MSALRIAYCAVAGSIYRVTLMAYATGLAWLVWTYLP